MKEELFVEDSKRIIELFNSILEFITVKSKDNDYFYFKIINNINNRKVNEISNDLLNILGNIEDCYSVFRFNRLENTLKRNITCLRNLFLLNCSEYKTCGIGIIDKELFNCLIYSSKEDLKDIFSKLINEHLDNIYTCIDWRDTL